MQLTSAAYECCELCPRRCGVNRAAGERGFCRMGAAPVAARAALHLWEEPPISGERGSGTIFFSGCTLACVYCQNDDISHGGFGRETSAARVAAMMLELAEQGAHNVNLVTATHFAPAAAEAVALARRVGFSLPVVWNTSGYETPELVDALADTVDVWLTDFKYASAELAGRFSAARDYPEVAAAALQRMIAGARAKGGRAEDAEGLLTRGVIVRHLVLPGCVDDSLAVLERVRAICGDECDLSVMNQYTPNARCLARGGELARPVTEDEYELVLDAADDLGFERLWWQEGGTVSESFIPPFDETGVAGPELKV